jgi:hypothetical protein
MEARAEHVLMAHGVFTAYAYINCGRRQYGTLVKSRCWKDLRPYMLQSYQDLGSVRSLLILSHKAARCGILRRRHC